MAVKKDVYQLAGGLDEDFFAHMEEIDLCWKFHRMNKKVFYTGHSVVYHVGAGTLAYDHPRKTYFNFRNNLMMVFKHWNSVELGFKLPVRIVLDWIAAFSFVIQGKSSHAGAILRAHRDFLSKWSKTRRKRRDMHSVYPRYTREVVYRGFVLFDYLFGREITYPQ
jgi:GT2 family glycosyltransferase